MSRGLKDRRKRTEVSTAVFGKIQFIVESAAKDGNIGSSHQVVKETRRMHIHRTQRFYNVTVGIGSSVVPKHIISFKNRTVNLDSILVAVSVNQSALRAHSKISIVLQKQNTERMNK